MFETIDLEATPLDEKCSQLGKADYEVRARAECLVYKKQLLRMYSQSNHDKPPEGCRLFVKSNDHDFGRYLTVAVGFDDSNHAAMKAAFWFEAHLPSQWDEFAKNELLGLDDGHQGTLKP